MHDFSSFQDGESVETTWVISNPGHSAISFDGEIEFDTTLGHSLPAALSFQFADTTQGAEPIWSAEIPFEAPVSMAQALELDDMVLRPGEALEVPVRVVLTNSGLVSPTPGRTEVITADFTVRYLSSPHRGESVPGEEVEDSLPAAAPASGPLATTGATGIIGMFALAGMLCAVGIYAVGSGRRDSAA